MVGLFNDHDGRREEDVRPWCDIFAHGFAELSLPLLRDYERPVAAHGAPLRALVVDGSPEPSSPALVSRLAGVADYVVVADGGADVCRAAGVVPDVFCGDGDSAGSEAAVWARSAARTCVSFPAEKYATDLALALDFARSVVREDEIYMSVNKDNPASLRVQQKNGAYIHHSDDKQHYTRIKL